MNTSKSLRWGILATGLISDWFAEDLRGLAGHTLAAVGSRSVSTARKFAAQHGIPADHAHGDYQSLVTDPTVDVVYVGTPHPMHFENAKAALQAGKPVLVEKSFTVTKAEAAELVSLARSKGLFLMEAMWTRFLPHIAEVRKILAAGTLGRVTTVMADHSQALYSIWEFTPFRLPPLFWERPPE